MITASDIVKTNVWVEEQFTLGYNDYVEIDRLYAAIAIDNPKLISYFTASKIKKAVDDGVTDSSIYSSPALRKKYAIMTKPGKLFRYLAPELDNEEVKFLVNRWRAFTNQYQEHTNYLSLESDIKKYYHHNKYASQSGSLGNSCMKHSSCQSYLDFYDNYDVKILVLKDDTGKISGRALIWSGVKIDKLPDCNTFMDRIYTNDENDETLFKEYADKNNIAYKNRQSYTNLMTIVFKGGVVSSIITVKPVNDFDLESMEYPFLDTLCGMDDNGTISNKNQYHGLQNVNGTADGIGDEYSIICADCEARFNTEEGGIYVEYTGHICDHCAENYSYCEDCDTYTGNDNLICINNDLWVCEDCADRSYHQCSECNEWLTDDDVFGSDRCFCESCFEETHDYCTQCDETFHNDDLEEGYCYDCVKDHTCKYCDRIEDDLTENDCCQDCKDDRTCKDCGVFDENLNSDSLCDDCTYIELIEVKTGKVAA